MAINAGGANTTYEGVDYQADRYSIGGTAHSTTDDINGTSEDALFQSERYGTFEYRIPVTEGSYSVTLHFAEIYETQAGARSFNVTIEDQTVLTELDLFSLAGHDGLYTYNAEALAVTDGSLNIAIETVLGNGKISGFAVFSTDGELDTSGPTPGEPLAVVPSEGCAKPRPANLGSANSPLPITQYNDYYVKLPNNYDPNTPYKLTFVFHHSSSDTNGIIRWGENSSGLEQQGALGSSIMVYPRARQTSGSGWRGWDEPMFEPLYNKVTSELCVDKNRVFALGYSSGGDYTSLIGCEHGDKLTAIVPVATKDVAGYPLSAERRQCKDQVAAIVVHGTMDSAVGAQWGPATTDFYRSLNNCSSESDPIAGYTDNLSNCVKYRGCDAGGEVSFCYHSNPAYSNTYHGYPPFTGKLAWDYFSSF